MKNLLCFKSIFAAFLFVFCVTIGSAQDFPSELIWEVQFDEFTRQLGSSWVEDGEVCALVTENSRLHIVRNGDVIWTSEEIENLMSAGRVDFGNGSEIVVTASAGDHAEVHHYFGDNLEEHAMGVYGSAWGNGGDWGENGSNFHSYKIVQKYNIREDLTESILIWCSRSVEDRCESGYSSARTGELYTFSLANMSIIEDTLGSSGMPASFVRQDLFGNAHDAFLFAGNSHSNSYSGNMDSESYGVIFIAWDEDNDEMHRAILARSGQNRTEIYGVTAYHRDGENYLIAGMYDYGLGFGVYSVPEFERIEWVPAAASGQLLGTVTGANDEQFLLTISSESAITAYLLPDFQEILTDPFLECDLGSAELQDFNDDGTTDLLMLVGNKLSLFSVGTLGIEDPIGHNPTSFSLSSPYPNPFNSTTTIGYSLPVAGNVSLAVYDLSGRELTQLVEGAQPAGTHEVVWTADGVSAGIYLVRLENNNSQFTQKILLVK